jgi:MFS family permease
MDAKLEKIYSLAGDEHRYQYIILIITFIVWTNVNVLPISLAYLEKLPDVNFTNPKTKEFANNVQLNYTICEYGKDSYNVTQTYNYSWVIEYNITCDPIQTGLIGTSIFAGEILGSVIFKVFSDKLGRKATAIYSASFLFIILISFTFAANITQIFIFTIIGGFVSTNTAFGSYFLVTEVVSSRRRAIFTALINTAFSFCGILYILLFKYLNNWRVIFYFASFLTITILIVYILYTIESPRLWLAKGDFNKFYQSLKKIAVKNNRLEIFQNELENNPESQQALEDIKTYCNMVGKRRKESLLQVLKEDENEDYESNFEYKDNTLKETLSDNKRKKYSIFALFKYKSVR